MQQPAGLEIISEASRYFAGPVDDPLEATERAHAVLYTLCDMLEQIADSLPGDISKRTCATLGGDLLPLLRDIHQFEEDSLYPLAIQRLGATPQVHSTIRRLQYEHCEDECFAEELSDALRELGGGDAPKNPEATGYMLRGFFEALRRHIAFERDHLLSVVFEANSDSPKRN